MEYNNEYGIQKKHKKGIEMKEINIQKKKKKVKCHTIAVRLK